LSDFQATLDFPPFQAGDPNEGRGGRPFPRILLAGKRERGTRMATPSGV
jgi:hypothetical protein